MEVLLHQPNNTINKNNQTSPTPDLEHPKETHLFTDEFDSTCSTPYVSAPSSPGRTSSVNDNVPINGGFFYSCPASPMHFAITSTASSYSAVSSPDHAHVPIGYEFEFSARLGSSESGPTGCMSSADELFLNGQIRPMKLSTHLERPQVLDPLLDLENEDEDEDDDDISNTARTVAIRGRDLRLRDKSLRRRTRSLSPLRSSTYEFDTDDEGLDNKNKNKTTHQIYGSNDESCGVSCSEEANDHGVKNTNEEGTIPSVSASSSRSSSAGRNSKRWVFLKDFLYRSKSEGRSNNKFWSNISFSPAKEKIKTLSPTVQVSASSKEKINNGSSSSSSMAIDSQKAKGNKQTSTKKPVNGVGKKRVPTSPHELHYKASKAQAEEMRKKTFLPYRQGLLGCLGFSSKGYGAMNGFARALNPVSSR